MLNIDLLSMMSSQKVKQQDEFKSVLTGKKCCKLKFHVIKGLIQLLRSKIRAVG